MRRSQPCEDQGLVNSGEAENSWHTNSRYTGSAERKSRLGSSEEVLWTVSQLVRSWYHSVSQDENREIGRGGPPGSK